MVKLTPQQFGTIFEALRNAAASGATEKRVSTRMEVQTAVKLAALDRAGAKIVRSFTGLTRDVSTCGVGLYQCVPAENGSLFLVGFPYGKSELILKASVRFSRSMAEGLFGIGGQFEALADEAQIAQWKSAQQGALDRIKSSILQ